VLDVLHVPLPAWAAKTLLSLLRQSFTGNCTFHFTNGHLASVQYSKGRCGHCGNQMHVGVNAKQS